MTKRIIPIQKITQRFKPSLARLVHFSHIMVITKREGSLQMQKIKFNYAIPTETDRKFLFIVLMLMLCLLRSIPVIAARTISEPITLSGNEVWNEDIIFDKSGEITLTGSLTISGAKISTTPEHKGGAVNEIFIVKQGGSLTLKDCIYDLSNLHKSGAHPHAIYANDGGRVTIDGTEISGAQSYQRAPGLIYIFGNSELNIINGSVIKNNERALSNGAIIHIADSKLKIDDSEISDNTITAKDPEPLIYTPPAGIIGVYGEESEVEIRNSVFRDNSFNRGSVICAENNYSGVRSISISGSTFYGNKQSASTDQPVSGAVLAVNTKLILGDGNIFEKNTADISSSFESKTSGAVLILNSEMIIEGNNRFIENIGSYAGAIYTEDSTSVIGNGNLFRENMGLNGTLLLSGSAMEIRDENVFRGNYGQGYGGAIFANNGSELTINRSAFIENNASYHGGAISQWGGKLTLNGTIFEKNEAYGNSNQGVGGAIAIDGRNLVAYNWGEYTERTELVINGAVFTNNTAAYQGGALFIGFHGFEASEVSDEKDRIFVYINRAEFTGNEVKSGYRAAAGGAIFINSDAHVFMKKAVITDNSTDAAGGGIASTHYGQIFLKPRNGAVIFGNHADQPGSGYEDLDIIDDSGQNLISQNLFNGGIHGWIKQHPVERTMVKGPVGNQSLINVTGSFYGASPSNTSIENADVLIRGNSVKRSSMGSSSIWPDTPILPENSAGNGGGIGNNGILEIGEDGVSLNIFKIWDLSGTKDASVPEPAEFLKSLMIYAGTERFEFGELIPIEHTSENNTDTYSFYASADLNVNFILRDRHDDHYEIEITGLPVLDEEDGIEYTINESMEGFDTQINGSIKDGFQIINTLRPVPDPEKENEISFFRLLDAMETLPQTGF